MGVEEEEEEEEEWPWELGMGWVSFLQRESDLGGGFRVLDGNIYIYIYMFGSSSWLTGIIFVLITQPEERERVKQILLDQTRLLDPTRFFVFGSGWVH